jgi:hypothetical protein
MTKQQDSTSNIVMGSILGALIGASLGLCACTFLFDAPPFFIGDTILIGAVICGVLGYYLGAGFIEWLKEHWWWF